MTEVTGGESTCNGTVQRSSELIQAAEAAAGSKHRTRSRCCCRGIQNAATYVTAWFDSYRLSCVAGRGDFVGGIDNESLDFSQLEDFINDENDAGNT
jgi:hypothetical protein